MKKYLRLLKKYNPAVSKHWLLALAGVMWAAVGVMLCSLAYGWLTHPFSGMTVACALAGILIALAANRWGFTRLAVKNIHRIRRLPARACLFAFQAWKGYAIIAGMITLGVILRHSPLPKTYLAIIYVAIGGALLQASLNYFARLQRFFSQTGFLGGRRARPASQD